MVSNGEFAEFVKDAGYARRELWTESGWGWKMFRNVKCPHFWVPEVGLTDCPWLDHSLVPGEGSQTSSIFLEKEWSFMYGCQAFTCFWEYNRRTVHCLVARHTLLGDKMYPAVLYREFIRSLGKSTPGCLQVETFESLVSKGLWYDSLGWFTVLLPTVSVWFSLAASHMKATTVLHHYAPPECSHSYTYTFEFL